MAFEKISEEELSKVGVELLDDKPALPASEVKQKFEETAKKLLAPKFNALVDALQAVTAAASLGAVAPDGLDGSTVQELLNALKEFADKHLSNKENPHGVKAAQTGAYTKEETDKAIDDKVVAIGAGDMSRAVYDPGHRGKDACVQLYTHSKSGTVHNFAGSGVNGIAKITAAFDSGDTVQLNGEPVTATCGADPVDGDTIVSGKWVAFVADAEAGQVNFKGGGGLGNTRLAQATAEPGDVVAGKTFYAGNKTRKTGLIPNYGREPLASKCGTWDPGGGVMLYLYLPNADTETQDQGGFLVRAVCIAANDAATALKNAGVVNANCVWAGRCWANGIANAAGYTTNGGYCTGGKGAYDAWINAGLSGYYAVWIDDNFSYRRYNAGERIAYRGPGQYGSARAAFVSV